MNKPFAKLIILTLILGFNSGGLLGWGQTFGFFNDTGERQKNIFSAGVLDMSANPEDLGVVSLDEIINLEIKQDGGLAFQYRFKIETSEDSFCQQLELKASSSEAVFAGQFKNFSGATTTISDLTDNWQLEIKDPSYTPAGQICNFSFIIQAWQNNQENYLPTFGFSDLATITGSIASGSGSGGPEYVTVLVPNGGEVWWVGRSYDLNWEASNPNGDDSALKINLYYSNDSGASWGLIVAGTENDGSYLWRVPLFLENGTYWVPSAKARLKVVAYYESDEMCGWDISDEDFCPPIDYGLITPEEAAWLEQAGLLDASPASGEILNNPISYSSPAPIISESGNFIEPIGESKIIDATNSEAEKIDPEPEDILDLQITEELNFTPIVLEDEQRDDLLVGEETPVDPICYSEETLIEEEIISETELVEPVIEIIFEPEPAEPIIEAEEAQESVMAEIINESAPAEEAVLTE